jgi:ATPase family AAA domain-containing protein 2
MKKPGEFPDPENRKKRVLEDLPVAPMEPPKPPTKAEMKALQKRDHSSLNTLKIQLQPIMDQINRKYKKFRQPVIPQSQIDYLFAESDPNFVTADVTTEQPRPFEIVKDKHGNDVLRHTPTGKTYYNLETTTIEERLSNGFYARPKDFLFDIKTLAKDARNIEDKERTLKANELLSNVEVDVASIEASSAHVDWEAIYRRQLQRAKEAAEKERKKKAMQSVIDRVQSDLGGAGNDSDSQGPVTLGEPVPGARTQARFQVRGSPFNDLVNDSHGLSNGTSDPSGGDVQMSGVDDSQSLSNTSGMAPPPKSAAATQISQRSAVTSLPPGVSPSQVINEASTTKTSDPSTHRSSNFSTQLTNGNHGEQRGDNDNDIDIPDTAPIPSQVTSSDEAWIHSQAGALRASRGLGSPTSPQSPPNNRTPASTSKSQGIGVRDILNDTSDSRNSGGSSASQPLGIEVAVKDFLEEMTQKTSGCTVEQLEQINRDIMDTIWRLRGEWNRQRVLHDVTRVFNTTIDDIEELQNMGPLSQRLRHAS